MQAQNVILAGAAPILRLCRMRHTRRNGARAVVVCGKNARNAERHPRCPKARLPAGKGSRRSRHQRAGESSEAVHAFRVANHSLHENASPILHEEPGGLLDNSACKFEAVSDRAVKISGMAWKPRPYSVKVEGRKLIGYRAITICATRDSDTDRPDRFLLEETRAEIDRRASAFGAPASEYKLKFHVYGRDGVMQGMEPLRDSPGHEICLVVEVIARYAGKSSGGALDRPGRHPKVDFPGRLCTRAQHGIPVLAIGH